MKATRRRQTEKKTPRHTGASAELAKWMMAFKRTGAMKTAMSCMNLRQLPMRKLRPKLTTSGRNIERFSLARRLRFGSTLTSPPPLAEKLREG